MIEAEIIQLIGYETILKFVYISDGMFTFKTIIPIGGNLDDYEITFYSEQEGYPDFFCYDSFSNFLLKYQISEVKRNEEVIYFKKFDS